MDNQFHLSIGVKSLTETLDFYCQVLNAKVTYRGDYANISLYGHQITLKEAPEIEVALPHLHFGINLPLDEFHQLAAYIENNHKHWMVSDIHQLDAGSAMARHKFYLRCPSGYLIELKGYADLALV